MIKEIYIKNFKGFTEHTICFKEKNIIVGKNNSGKTSLIDALKFVHEVISFLNSDEYNYYKYQVFKNKPQNKGIKGSQKGLILPINTTEFDLNQETIFNNYNAPPAIIETTFKNGSAIIIYILPKKIFIRLKDRNSKFITSLDQLEDNTYPIVDILPQLTLLKDVEIVYDWGSNFSSKFQVSSSFRQNLCSSNDVFSSFKKFYESINPEIELMETNFSIEENNKKRLFLLIREKDFVSEVSSMGHGMQIWIQLLFFIFCNENTVPFLNSCLRSWI